MAPLADLSTGMTVFYVGVLVVTWAALGAVVWVFWRAKKREDERRKESEWPNARWS